MLNGVLGLELSSKQIRYVYAAKKNRKIFLLKQGKTFLQDSTSANEPANLTNTIREITAKEKIYPSRICLTISAENLFIHLAKLPTLPEAELDEVIGDEIKKVPKFLGKEFDYIYNGYKIDPRRQRVLFCAIEKGLLDSAIQGARSTGMHLESLETSPLNLLESLYSKITRDKTEVLLFLDSKATYVIIFGQNECKLFFKMATGASDMESHQGSINVNTFSAWIEEIKRVFKSYQREFSGKEFGTRDMDKIWLVWDSDKLQDLYELTSKELGQEVTRPTPENFGLQLADKAAEFNPVYLIPMAGPLLYLRGQRQRFNFKHFLHKLKLEELIRNVSFFVLIYLAAATVLIGGIALNYALAGKRISAKEKTAVSRIALLEKQTTELRRVRDNYLAAKKRLLNQATFVRMLNRFSWSEILANIGLALPDDISLSSFAVPENGEVKLEGATVQIESVAELIRKIGGVSFLTDVKFDFLRERKIKEKDIALDKIIEFGIGTILKADTDEKKDVKDIAK
jgi:Tfp pilus assembly protein PilN